MNSDKVLVVYFSKSGNTRIIANEISRKLHCDIEELRIPSSYSGFLGYQRALFDAIFKRKTSIKPLTKKPSDYELVIVGGPLFASSLTGPVRSFLDLYKNEFKNVAFFLTQAGENGRTHYFNQMKSLIPKKPLAFLAITEKDLASGAFKNSVSEFLNQLPIEQQLTKEKANEKKFKIHSGPSPTIGV